MSDITTDTNVDRPSGLDLAWVDETVSARDDLYVHVNGIWLAEHTIPDDRPIDGAFNALRDRAEENVRDIITEAARSGGHTGSDAQRIGDLYASFDDIERIEKLGIAPITPLLSAVDNITEPRQLARFLGESARSGTGATLFGFYVDTDAKQSDRYLVHIVQAGIGLPDESYYREEVHNDTRRAYKSHLTTMFGLAGFDDPGDCADRVLALETAIASHHWDVVKRRDAELSYNLRTFDELAADVEGFDIREWIDGLDAEVDPAFAEVIVAQPSFLSGVGAMFSSQSLEDWKLWTKWHILHATAPYLSSEFVDENFDFYGKTLTGAPQIRDRWKRGVQLVEGALGFAVGKLYVAEHFPPEAKARMDELIANLIAAYRRNITDLSWMSPATRTKALAKLDKFTAKIGYPANWRDYSGLEISRDDLMGNIVRANVFEVDRELAKIGEPVDRDEWFMTPQTVNAYYNPGMNEIVFPAAILQPPFFDPGADDAANYGGIGAVIGHEIGHGFDDQGAKYDGDGNLVDWWTDTDRKEFALRTEKLIKQYDEYTPTGLEEKYKVNGSFTIGENIGDLGGLSIALVAYQIATQNIQVPVIDGLTGLQRVFFGWAQVWRTKTREAEAIRRLSIDPHSPPEFRCNGVVRNIDAFYHAFEVVPGDRLYLEPQERVRIW